MHDDAVTSEPRSSPTASASDSHRSSSSRSSTWIGTPPSPPSAVQRRKFRPKHKPALDRPILPRMPASVSVANQRPSSSTVHSSGVTSGCQSQFCSIIPGRAMSEHSGPPSSSVRACIANSPSAETPAPSATPTTSASRPAAATASRTAGPNPLRPGIMRSYTATFPAIASPCATPSARPRAPGSRSVERWRRISALPGVRVRLVDHRDRDELARRDRLAPRGGDRGLHRLGPELLRRPT